MAGSIRKNLADINISDGDKVARIWDHIQIDDSFKAHWASCMFKKDKVEKKNN